jgi:hypothetical protein
MMMLTRMNPMRFLLSILAITGALMAGLFPTSLAIAQPDIGVAAKLVPSAELVGKGRMTYFGFKVFDAALYAPDGKYTATSTYALKLTYLRNLKGKAIAERSVKEMRRQGYRDEAKLAEWLTEMESIFPNVSNGSSIIGVRDSSGHAVFFKNGRRLGSIKDSGFTRRFFAIWLGRNTKDPSLRAKLIGKSS